MIRFRSHHFLCTYNFQGLGYSKTFIKNYFHLKNRMEQESIKVVQKTDDICSFCPHNKEDICVNKQKIIKLDNRHSSVLGINVGDVFAWDEIKTTIEKKVNFVTFYKMCRGCEWQTTCHELMKSSKKNYYKLK